MDFAGVASVVGITVICYLAGMIPEEQPQLITNGFLLL